MLTIEMKHPNRRLYIDQQTVQALSRRFKHLAMFALILMIVVAACARTLNRPLLSGDLPIEAPATATAGDQLNITIGPVNAATDGTPVGLVMVGNFGPRVYNTTFESGLAHFTIPSQDTRQPGYLALIVAADDARGEASIILFSAQESSVSNPNVAPEHQSVANAEGPKHQLAWPPS